MINKCELCRKKHPQICHDCNKEEYFEIITYEFLDKLIESHNKTIESLKNKIDVLKTYLEEQEEKTCDNCHCFHDESGSNCQGSDEDICHEWRKSLYE
jgi:hypothetical protein